MNIYQTAENLLFRDYEIVSDKTDYPFGRHRGDVKSLTVYKRKDGNNIPESDIEVLKTRDIESSSRDMAALCGIYTTSFSDDLKTLSISYYQHTAG